MAKLQLQQEHGVPRKYVVETAHVFVQHFHLCTCGFYSDIFECGSLQPIFFDLPNTSPNQGLRLEQERKNRSKIATDPVLSARTHRPNREQSLYLFVASASAQQPLLWNTDDNAKADINRERHRKFVIPNSDGTRSEARTSIVDMPLMQTHGLLLDACCSSGYFGGGKKNLLASFSFSFFFVPQGTAQLESDALQEFIMCSIYWQLAELKRPAEKGSAAGWWKMWSDWLKCL